MRLIGLILIALVAVAQPAAAQAPDRVGPPPPVRPRDPPPPPKPLAVAPRPAQSFAGALTGFQPLRPFPPLVGLAPAGDPAPLCRAACAKVHNQCGGGEDSCDANWTQCLIGCRTAR